MEFVLLILGLALLAVIGHGIWVTVAMILRALVGTKSPAHRPRDSRWETCPQCLDAVLFSLRRCERCHLDLHSVAARELRDLRTTARELDILVQTGHIDGPALERIRASI